jgi:flagellin-like hook-associated protein FlgL
MTSITLSASIRANLLSLQNTTRLLDATANRLSTGKRVNSALDNPGSFFTARSLTNRASDLNNRKDSIGQAISLLESTDKSLTSLTSLVEQAKAKAQQADEAATGGITNITTEKATSVTGITTFSTAFGAGATSDAILLTDIGVTADEDILFTVNGTITTLTIAAAETIATFVTSIDALFGISASFNTTTNQIDITGNGGSDITITDGATTAFAGLGGFKADGTIIAEGVAKVFATTNTDTDLLTDVFGVADGDTLVTSVTSGGASVFTIESGDSAAPSTIADLVAAINASDTALTASYNTTTSKIDIKAAEGVAVTFSGTGTGFSALTLNDGTNNVVSATAVTYSKLGSATEVGALTTDFRSLLTQIDALISDASYKGKNLLKGSTSLDVKFNVAGDSKLTISGKALENDSSGILSGLKFTQKAADYDFTTAGDITAALADVESAITELRTVSSTFGTSLGIIQTREDFTIGLVNALESGAGKLVNASLEEESAKLLALQTRQALGIQSLSIANQSQQSILALFR